VIQGHSWIWNGDVDVKSLNNCLRTLIGSAIGDGNLLLNFGPRPDGSITPIVKERYEGIGSWLAEYGESIYKTRGGPYKPGFWGGSTRRDRTIYLHITQKWPGGVLKLPPLPAKVLSCRALTGGEPEFRQTEDGLEIKLAPGNHAAPSTVIALTVDREAMDIEPIESPGHGYSLTTDARVTASSSIDPENKKGAPETVVHYSFETGVVQKQFGEESDVGKVDIVKKTQGDHDIDKERIQKIIGNSHRGHFWRFWKPLEEDKQPWIELDLGTPETFDRVSVTELYGQVRGYELQYFDSGVWQTFYANRGVIDQLSVHLKERITAQRIRLQINGTSGVSPSIVSFDLF
jgi:alpha-L-fucosidase